MAKVTQGQLIALMSHTLGSIGQVLKDAQKFEKYTAENVRIEIDRIYKGYIVRMASKWEQE